MQAGERLFRESIAETPGDVGVRSFEFARLEAENGSEILRLALERAFERFEYRHRLQPGEAAVLLLDTGVRL